MNVWLLLYVVLGATLVGAFVEEASRSIRTQLTRIEAKLDALSETTPRDP